MKKIILVMVMTLWLVQIQAGQNLKLEIPSIFSNTMVLQQKSKVPFWGRAIPGESVQISADWGANAQTWVNPDSTWQVRIETPSPGGTYQIKLQIGDSLITWRNILIGEVWVCSGQSNMEMPLQGWPPQDTIQNSAEEILQAQNPQIRLFTVNRAFAVDPQFNYQGTWQECNSQSAATFSATAYFFAKKLQKELNIPIGLIHTSWGGTPIEAWISRKHLQQVGKYQDLFQKLQNSVQELANQNEWLETLPQLIINPQDQQHTWKNLNFQDARCELPDYDDGKWRNMDLPINWEYSELGNFDGTVWYRRKVTIPLNWCHQELVLNLGPIDDMDAAYINGQKIGAHEQDGFWQIKRSYPVTADLVQDTQLMIAVRVIDNQGGGGIYGKKEDMELTCPALQQSLSVAGTWKYLPVAEYRGGRFYLYGSAGEKFYKRPPLTIDLSAYTPTLLYNAMISPLIPFAIRGAIWYQGESNTGNAEEYKRLLPMLISNWRQDWKLGDFPFYYAQIAPYQYSEGTNSQYLREAQMQSLSVPHTGMAVTMDIASLSTVHPPNKQDVGERLARWALANDYGRKIPFSGPIYQSMEKVKNKIILRFNYADQGLVIKPIEGKTCFQIAGSDQKFRDALIEIKGSTLVISAPGLNDPIAVRYAWSDTALGTLFNREGLPASSFRTDQFKPGAGL